MKERQQVEEVTGKVSHRTTAGVLWRPDYSMKVYIGQDDEPWAIDSIDGVGTAIFIVKLWRPYVVNILPKNRERGGR